MKLLIVTLFCIYAVTAVPVPEEKPKSIELLQIPLKGDKELDILTLGDQEGSYKERSKRTIGVLRELFPNLSKMIEQKIQGIVQFLFRTIGPLILRGGLGGGAGGGTSGASTTSSFDDDFEDSDEDTGSSSNANASGRKVAVSLPTFPPFEDSEEDTKANEAVQASPSSTATSFDDDDFGDGPSKISLDQNAAGSSPDLKTNESNSVR